MSMTCKIARDLTELYFEGLVSSESKQAIQSHLKGCRHCRAYYHTYQKLQKQDLVMQSVSEEDMAETEVRLYQNISEKMRKHRFWHIVSTSAAIGAGSVMLAIGLFLTWHQDK